MARMITTQEDYALRALMDAEYGRELSDDARERVKAILGPLHEHSRPRRNMLERNNHPESMLHSALYDVLQNAVSDAGTTITQARDLAYFVEKVIPEDLVGKKDETVTINARNAETLRWLASSWLDSFGRDKLKESDRG